MGDFALVGSAQKVVDLVVDGKLPMAFALSDLQRKNLSGLKGKQAKDAMDQLINDGWVKCTETANTKGKPTVVYTMHPEIKKHENYALPPPSL